ncbi:MAG: 30S ribosomal protein S6 [Dehalococcoidia bacterium]|nr:30S ribosomal protein S6 [Dehalococcoidia bacterium]
MRHYELVVVLSPMLNQEQVTETWDKIKGFITTRDAEISHEEQWGTRRLAYPIRKGQHRFLEGSYHLTRFATEKAFNIDLENFLKVDEEILRSLVTVTLPEEELAAQAAAAARAIRPPPPRPAPVGPDGQPIPSAAPAEGAAPAAEAPAADAPAPEALATEAPAAEAAPEPVAEEALEDATETSPEAVTEPTAEVESEPAAPENDNEGDDTPAEETTEPTS